jgi:hypothetical protein
MLIRILPIFQSVSVMKNAVKGKSAMLQMHVKMMLNVVWMLIAELI